MTEPELLTYDEFEKIWYSEEPEFAKTLNHWKLESVVAAAQLAKDIAFYEAKYVGWKSPKEIAANYQSPQECRDCVHTHDMEVALNERSCMAAEGWLEPDEANNAIQQARSEALREVLDRFESATYWQDGLPRMRLERWKEIQAYLKAGKEPGK